MNSANLNVISSYNNGEIMALNYMNGIPLNRYMYIERCLIYCKTCTGLVKEYNTIGFVSENLSQKASSLGLAVHA